MSLTFAEFRRANVLRSVETFKRNPKGNRNMVAFALGMGEETGEALGAVRGFTGITKRKKGKISRSDIGHEVADSFFYGDLVVACAELLTEDVLQEKYNKTSERSGSPYRLKGGKLYRLDGRGKMRRA